MDSFEELDLDPALVDALAALGIERPTPFQVDAVPVLRKGNNVVGRAGPGAGTLAAWGAALLDRIADERGPVASEEEPDEDGPGSGEAGSGEPGSPRSDRAPLLLVLAPTPRAAERVADSVAPLADAVDLRAAALDGPWLLPERADVVAATPAQAVARMREGRLSLTALSAVVVDQLTQIAALGDLADLETLFDAVGAEVQQVVLDVPTRDIEGAASRERAEAFVEAHVRRAVSVPSRSVADGEADVPDRGSVHFRVVPEPKHGGGLALVAHLFETEQIDHLVVFFRNEDEAADAGDDLTRHGYAAGAPGGPEPVWLAVDELEARAAMDDVERLGVLSWDVPAGPDALDRRHGAGRGGWILALAREVAHLRAVARRTGYGVVPFPPPAEERVRDDLVSTVEAVEHALETEDVSAYLLLLETLFEEHDPAEVAAAAVALLRRKRPGVSAGASPAADAPSGEPVTVSRQGTPVRSRGTPWVRLFVSLGSRDGAGPGDIVGAISGESGVDGSKVGRIDLRESFSIVEVEEPVAERIIRALNGKTIKGRSVRVDYDRPGREKGGEKGRGGRGGGGRRGGGRRSPGGARS